jgi:RNA polymerase sigma-70 factor (ECF subfamily)
VDIDKLAYTLPDRQPDQSKKYDDRQVSKAVSDALFALPERQRTALMLVYYSELTNIEAAKIMGISVDAIESLLSRGKRMLRDVLSGSKTTLLEGYNG